MHSHEGELACILVSLFLIVQLMPIVLIIIGLAVAIGLGGYFLRPEEIVTPVADTELPATPEAADGTTVPTS